MIISDEEEEQVFSTITSNTKWHPHCHLVQDIPSQVGCGITNRNSCNNSEGELHLVKNASDLIRATL